MNECPRTSKRSYKENLSQYLDHFWDEATAKGYRYVDWNAALRNAIRDDWAGLHKPTSAAIPGHAPGDKRAGLVSRNGDALSDWLGGGDITVSPPHDLRHTCAAHLVSAGVALAVVRDLLGHASITMTERYAHLAPENIRTAVAVLDTASRSGHAGNEGKDKKFG